jgi:hypothetical protein
MNRYSTFNVTPVSFLRSNILLRDFSQNTFSNLHVLPSGFQCYGVPLQID